MIPFIPTRLGCNEMFLKNFNSLRPHLRNLLQFGDVFRLIGTGAAYSWLHRESSHFPLTIVL